MKKYLTRRGDRRKAGFTLIELLVVVLIIGILVAIAIPQYFKVMEKSRQSDMQNFVSLVKQSQERYMAKNGAYQTSAVSNLTSLDISFEGASPSFGMRDWQAAAIAAGAGCPAGITGWTITMNRMATNTAVPGRYGTFYNVQYNSCAPGVFTYNNANATTDF